MIKRCNYYILSSLCAIAILFYSSSFASNSSIKIFGKFIKLSDFNIQSNLESENSNSNYVFDWAEIKDQDPDVEMVKSLSNCTTTSTALTLCSGSSFTITHGTVDCCDANARLYYYNGYTNTWTYGTYNTDQYSYTISNASVGTYTFTTRILGANGSQYCTNSITVTVSPTPGATTVTGGGTFCGNAVLTASGPCGGTQNIGTGTSTTNSQPLYSWYNYSRSCQLILRNEMTCNPGVITHLAVYVGTVGSHTFTSILLRLKKTTATTAPTTFPGDGTIVWSGSYTFNTTGWVTFDITDFNWDSDNLLIEWQHGSTAYTSNYPYFYYTTTATNLSTYSYSDGSLPTTGTNTTIRPNYRLTFAAAPTIYWQGTTSNGTSTATPSTSQTVTSSGTYYFRAYNGSCWGAQGSQTVTIHQPPTAPTSITGTASICEGQSTTLTASGGSTGSGCTYQWYAGGCGSGSVLGTGVSLIVSPTSSTTYYVRRVGTTTCTNTTGCASLTVTVNSNSTAPTSITPTINP